MTGVVNGSGGTGVLAGSRPGTGVTGGSGPPSNESGNEYVLLEADSGSGYVPVASYSAPFDVSANPMFDSVGLPVPREIVQLAASESIIAADVEAATVTDDLSTPVPLAIQQLSATETIGAADVSAAVVTDEVVHDLAIRSAIMATAPRYYWPIAGQSYVNDGSAGAEPLTAISAPPFITDPIFGTVPNMAAGDAFTTDAAVSPSISGTDLNAGFTLGIFAKLDGASPVTNYLIEFGNTPASFSLRNFDFYIDLSAGTVNIQLYNGGVRTLYTSPAASYPADGQWHHVAAQYDLANVRIWVDGALVLTTARAVAQTNNGIQRMVIGGTDASGTAGGPGAAYVYGGPSPIPSVVHPFLSPGDVTTAQILAIAEAAGLA